MKKLTGLSLVAVAIFCFSCTPDENEIITGTNISEHETDNPRIDNVFATEGEEEAPPAKKGDDW